MVVQREALGLAAISQVSIQCKKQRGGVYNKNINVPAAPVISLVPLQRLNMSRTTNTIEMTGMAQSNSPSRIPTLESGSQSSLESVGSRLESSIADPANAESRRSRHFLKHEYTRVKRRRIYHGPPKDLKEASMNLEPRTEWMINLWTFTSPEPVHGKTGTASR